MIEFKKLTVNKIEYRFDPLTKDECRINPARAKRIKQAESDVNLNQIIERSKQRCAFCPEKIEKETPQFSKNICEKGRIRKGETIIFPNLNPFGEHHAVGVICKEHFLKPSEFDKKMLRDNLIASKEYITSVYKNDKEAMWPIWVWNYMPPSAGSIIHPHVQILVEKKPVPQLLKIIEKSKFYFEKNKKNYWKDLVDKERKTGKRFITENNSLSIITSFAPRGFNEIQFLFNNASSILDLEQKQIEDFADSLKKVLYAYDKMNIGSFNLISFSGCINKKVDYYSLNFKLISRPYPRGVYTNDTGPTERLYNIWVIDTLPEEVCKNIKSFF